METVDRINESVLSYVFGGQWAVWSGRSGRSGRPTAGKIT